MAIGASRLVLYGCNTMAENDNTFYVGGAINTHKKVVMTEIAPAGRVEMTAAAGNTGSLDIAFRKNTGVRATELKNLAGATVVTFAATMERILTLSASTSVHGLITVRKLSGGTNLASLPNGVSALRRLFIGAIAPDSGTKSYYEKVFYRNNHGTLALQNCSIIELADPTGKITFALDGATAACPLSLSVNNGATSRLHPPLTRISSFSGATRRSRNNGTINPGSAQGVWLRLLLSSTDAATKTSYTLRLKGNSA